MAIKAKKGRVKHKVAPFLQDRIKDEVNRESLEEWAKKETTPFKVVPGLPIPPKMKKTPLHAFMSQILP